VFATQAETKFVDNAVVQMAVVDLHLV